jgi:cell division septum initiation protein DivIVA
MVLRGYDRIEVDQYISRLLEENAALRRELESGAPRTAEPGRSPVPDEPSSHHYDVDTPAEDSFGFRAEKLLRLAERESAEMRTRATRDAEAVEATARRRAEEQLQAAEREADAIRERASAEAGRLTQQAGQEAARVVHLHRATKDELRRLAGLLDAELDRPDPTVGEPASAPQPAAADDGPAAANPGTAASNP